MGQETEGIVDHWSWKPSSTVSAAIMIKGLHVRAILLDPSCSGSGTSAVRLDHLLPSHGAGALYPQYFLEVLILIMHAFL
ncbi:hypothetical protein RHGRI_014427 [Rhododendron griersonianum]|uniref:SAM-dependent MTase RsmB/NOP-type domain-containing protein n=1 Tax=Rhododendron griersonianum TaxID=479676 RepID=A0AAV6K9L1_9ERIC|nr:hypothetical protein RHGRI_014427 [Rhododendron griersonianum]